MTKLLLFTQSGNLGVQSTAHKTDVISILNWDLKVIIGNQPEIKNN